MQFGVKIQMKWKLIYNFVLNIHVTLIDQVRGRMCKCQTLDRAIGGRMHPCSALPVCSNIIATHVDLVGREAPVSSNTALSQMSYILNELQEEAQTVMVADWLDVFVSSSSESLVKMSQRHNSQHSLLCSFVSTQPTFLRRDQFYLFFDSNCVICVS